MNNEIVLAECNITGGELHKLATTGGKTYTLGQFGIRFILKSSFKANNSNFIINSYAMQVIATEHGNVTKPKQVATMYKNTGTTTKKKKKQQQKQLNISDTVTEKTAW